MRCRAQSSEEAEEETKESFERQVHTACRTDHQKTEATAGLVVSRAARQSTGSIDATRTKTTVTPQSEMPVFGRRKSNTHRERWQEFNLKLDIMNLKYEIESIHRMRQLLANRAQFTRDGLQTTCVRTMVEYFRLFRTWYAPEIAGLRGITSNDRITATTQHQFLENMVHPQIDIGDGLFGFEAMWNQVVTDAQILKPVLIEMRSYGVYAVEKDVIVEVDGFSKLLISRATIETVFSHLLAHESIANKPIGKVVEAHNTAEYLLDPNGKMIRCRIDVDYIPAMLKLLGSLEEVAIVMGSARIGMSGVISKGQAVSNSRANNQAHRGNTKARTGKRKMKR